MGLAMAQGVEAGAMKPGYGLFPADYFQTTNGQCADCTTIPQALWYFRDEVIAVPKAGQPVAGFERSASVQNDLAAWAKITPVGSAPAYPPLVWIAAPNSVQGVRLSADGKSIKHSGIEKKLALIPKLPLNGSYFDAHSIAFFQERSLRLRGTEQGASFLVRSFWPEDFRLPAVAGSAALKADPSAFRDWVRAMPRGGAESPFVVESIWRQQGVSGPRDGQPILGLMLNGAQGDDDEAQGGHFGVMAGRVGEQGAIADWLVNNFYSLDLVSEKGILAAPVPLENYLGDLNSGQAWYRPSYLLVATLKDERTAAHLQSAFGRVYNQFYRHQFAYQHARANCAGISVMTARAVGWQVPSRGSQSWLKAIFTLPYVAITEGNLSKCKAVFDYLTEDQTTLSPGVAFAEMGADLLRLVNGQTGRSLTAFEQLLAEDIEEMLLVRVPQLPSSRAWGDYPVESTSEYLARVPKDPAEQKIIPVPPRPFPDALRDPQTPAEPPLRSDYAVAAWVITILGLIALLLRRFLA